MVDFNCPVQPWWLVGDVVSPCCSHSGWFWTFVLVLVAAIVAGCGVLVAAIVAGVDFVSPFATIVAGCGLW